MAEPVSHTLDVVTIGRSSVDLYGQQIGARLEDVTSFAKSVGGCPSNIAIGTSRLGLKSAVITRVGNEQMGGFIRKQMAREGVNGRGIVTDPERLTALVLLSVENDSTFPLIFYRENCADMALCEDDIDPAFIRTARAVLVTGTHFSQPGPAAAQRKAIAIARENGAKVIFDIDYRPNLWGLAGHAAGDERYIASAQVSEQLKTVLADCDLIVGTEEEVLIASGESNLHAALCTIRAISHATIVLKRGPMGCIVYDGAIPEALEDGIVGRGFPIEVYNVLGAGDSFMSGFLRGWLRGEDHATSATWANACGAFAVSRLLCAPEIPTWEELEHFLAQGSPHHALRKDERINHIHWATTRARQIPSLMAFAIDHRAQLVEMANRLQADPARIADFKCLAVEAAAQVAAGREGYGMLLDERFGRRALFDAARHNFSWIGRPVELPGSRPLRFEFSQDIGSQLIEWPNDHCIKVLCFYNPDDDATLKQEQQDTLLALYQAARKIGRELLIEIIAGKHGALDDDTVATALDDIYARGIKPDWWKLEPQASPAAWANVNAAIRRHDPYCRGIVLLGLDAPTETLRRAFEATAEAPLVRGFAVGRTLFADAAEKWLGDEIGDAKAIDDMAGRFDTLCRLWHDSRNG